MRSLRSRNGKTSVELDQRLEEEIGQALDK